MLVAEAAEAKAEAVGTLVDTMATAMQVVASLAGDSVKLPAGEGVGGVGPGGVGPGTGGVGLLLSHSVSFERDV